MISVINLIKYIVLDVDRTLVDSFKVELLSFEEAMNNTLGYKLNKEQIKSFTTMPTRMFLKSLDLNDEDINKVMKEWGNTFSKYKTKCFSGIKEVIKKLHSDGYKFGLITSRTIDEYHELDEELMDVKEIFEVIVTSDIVKSPKPNLESMEYLCNKFNCSCKDIIYIGDSYIDKEFAKNSNCYFIPACYDNKELSNEENACFNPNELLEIINRING